MLRIERIADNVPRVQIVRRQDVPDRVLLAKVLDVDVPHARLPHERRLGRYDELVVARDEHRHLVAGLHDRLAVGQAPHRGAIGGQVVPGLGAEGVLVCVDNRSGQVAVAGYEFAEAGGRYASRGRCDRNDFVDERRDALEFGHV